VKRKKVLCIGSGLAALNVAVHLGSYADVFILSPGGSIVSNSFMARGGCAVATGSADLEEHIHDTLVAGAGLCDEQAVRSILSEAVELPSRFRRMGFQFEPGLAREGGHTVNRIFHIGDETGRHLTLHWNSLAARKPNIHFLHNHVALELVIEQVRCTGVKAADLAGGRIKMMKADAVVLASGGGAGLYAYNTNNPTANGEGYAMAVAAGAHIRGMEFIQFHPTLLHGTTTKPFLLTEALRGAGAVIRDRQGRHVMEHVHELGSLAPRDIVSRTLFERMKEQETDHLWLDCTEVDPSAFQKHFTSLTPGLQRRLPMLPVCPAAHYTCGGVVTTLDGRTNIPGLFAAGEVADTGLHGANRLASNSLTELFIMSGRIATAINHAESISGEPDAAFEPLVQRFGSFCAEGIRRVRELMWQHAGIVRSGYELREAITQLNELAEDAGEYEACSGEMQFDLRLLLNRITTARMICGAALARTENVGCHFRNDAGRPTLKTMSCFEQEEA
jgi:L-aspartate oxidase